jgi:hypothetical protein
LVVERWGGQRIIEDKGIGATDPVPVWAEWTDEQLLDLRMCDLDLRLEGTFYQEPMAQLSRELETRRLTFRPHFWISDEWFTPDGVPGIAVPFYLAHPRLTKLEATSDVGSGRRHQGLVHADPPARGRSCH